MDFVRGVLADGRPFRILTVVDNWSRQSPLLEVGFRMSGVTASQALDRVLAGRSRLVDHGGLWDGIPVASAGRFGVSPECPAGLHSPRRPVENAFIEAFNGLLRDECLNLHQFTSRANAQAIIEARWVDYISVACTACSGTWP